MHDPASPARPVADDRKATEHLANERTFLAWVRTSIAVISLGFVVAKFGLWLERMSDLPGARLAIAMPQTTGWSLPIGAGMMGCGALLAVLAAWHHRRTTRDIEHGHVTPAWNLVVFVSALVVLLAAVMTVYLFISAGRR